MRRATVILTDTSGATRVVSSSALGYYHFADVAAGQTYVFEARHRRYQFSAQVVAVNENLDDLNFAAQ